jgi:pimeloyl-ACP methyl ester carboxylesterase
MKESITSGPSRRTTWKIAFALVVGTLLALLAAFVLYAQEPATDSLVGVWQGTVTAKPGSMQIFFTIEKKSDGSYMAKVDIPAQKARDIPVTGLSWNPPDLMLDMSSYGIVYEGKMAPDGAAIAGLFKIGDDAPTLVVQRAAAVPDMRRPQEPQKPYPYEEIEVTFRNGAAAIDLSGTLTMPAGPGPFPAVVLISGSGPQDRNSAIAGHRPFLVVADYLTRRGIAVLRHDDRGCNRSGGNFHSATTADFASDAAAAWEFLARQPRIDPRRVGLYGHSEGGVAAPMAAARNQKVAFLVLMAGTGIPGERLARMQVEAIARSRGAGEEAVSKEVRLNEGIFGVLKTHKDAQAAEKEMKRIALEALAGMSAEEKKQLNESEEMQMADIKSYVADYDWNRFFLFYDPAVSLRRVHCPVLALNGEKDTQVDADANLPAIAKALKEGGNQNVETAKLPGLNHLFQTAQSGHPSEYGKIEETVSPAVLQLVGDWILQLGKVKTDS